MSRDWEWTWEHWHELSEQERGRIREEIYAEHAAAAARLKEATAAAAKAWEEFHRKFPDEALG